METLFSLTEKVRRCVACSLWKNRTVAVPGSGPNNAKIMIIGESPAKEEDKQGYPFIGSSGKFLDKILTENGLDRKNIYLTNCLKCYSNKTNRKELNICVNLWLRKEIEIINPKIIVLLGRTAIENTLGKVNLNKKHGQLINQKYFITYHPSAARRFPKIRKYFENDFKNFSKIVRF